MKTITIITLLLASFLVNAQVTELDEKRGFQDIKLGSDPKGYSSLEFKKTTKDDHFKKNKKDESLPEVDLYVPSGENYEEVGGIKIHKLIVKAFDNKIYSIEILAEKNPDFYKGLEARYGEANYSLPSNSYVWNGKEVRLSFKSHSKNKVMLTYFMFAVKDWIKAKEKETLKSIADDF